MKDSLAVVQLVVAALMIGGMCVALLSILLRSRVRRKMVLRSPPVNVSDLHDGQVATVVGTVRAQGEPLVAPGSGKPCVYFHVVFLPPPSRYRATLAEEEKGQDFLLADSTGEVVVHLPEAQPASAGISNPASCMRLPHVSTALQERRYTKAMLGPDRWRAFVARFGWNPDQLTARGEYEICETLVEPGDQIAIRGSSTSRLDDPERRAHMSPSDSSPLTMVTPETPKSAQAA